MPFDFEAAVAPQATNGFDFAADENVIAHKGVLFAPCDFEKVCCPGCKRPMTAFKRGGIDMHSCRLCKRMFRAKGTAPATSVADKATTAPVKSFDGEPEMPPGVDPIHKIGGNYLVNPNRHGNTPFRLTGFAPDANKQMRAMFDHPQHGSASMSLGQFNKLQPVTNPAPKASEIPKAAPASANAPPSNPDSYGIEFDDSEIIQTHRSPLLPIGTSKPANPRPPVDNRVRSAGSTRNASSMEDPEFRTSVKKLANHLTDTHRLASGPGAFEPSKAYESIEHLQRQPAMVAKHAFATAFPHLVTDQAGGYPADAAEASSRYMRLLGGHMFERNRAPEKPNIERSAYENENRPHPLDLASNLDRIRSFEKNSNAPWLGVLLKNLHNSHPERFAKPEGGLTGADYANRFDALNGGELSETPSDRRRLTILLDKLHQAGVGSVTKEQLLEHVLPQFRSVGKIGPGDRRAMIRSHASTLPGDASDVNEQAADPGYRPGGGGGRFVGQGMRTPEEMSAAAASMPVPRGNRRRPAPAAAPTAAPTAPPGAAPAEPSVNSSASPATQAPPQHKQALETGTFNINGYPVKAQFGGKVISVRGKPYVFFAGQGGQFHVPLDRIGQFIEDHLVPAGASFDSLGTADFDLETDDTTIAGTGKSLSPQLPPYAEVVDFDVKGDTDEERIAYLHDKGYSPYGIYLTLREWNPQAYPTIKAVDKTVATRPAQPMSRIQGFGRLPTDAANEATALTHPVTPSYSGDDPNLEGVMNSLATNHFRDNLRREVLLRHLPAERHGELDSSLGGDAMRQRMNGIEEELRAPKQGQLTRMMSKNQMDSYLDHSTTKFLKSHQPTITDRFKSGIRNAASTISKGLDSWKRAAERTTAPHSISETGGYGDEKVGNPYIAKPGLMDRITGGVGT